MPSSSSTPAAAGSSAADDNTLRILLATDIHLGYGEKHPVKAPDSFVTFEEILSIAIERKVDMVLLGGDLFHDNKPSRDAEMRCVDLLRRYVLGSDPVAIQLVSDPEVNFAHCGRKEVNYLDPNMNIGLPVFSIHGNHDDPSGLGGHSCMDLLHATGLINYFGRTQIDDDNKNEVRVSPLLIQKGEAKLALYGMSAIKDERLHRMFRANKVIMMRPEDDTESWFNLLVLHQNRVKHGLTNYIPEHFIDEFVDLVFWGHEHECRLDPEVGANNRLYVTQPGSSVATSLCEGEAKEKMVGILEIKGRDFKIDPVPLKTVRPMIFKTINIEEATINFDGNEKDVQGRIETYLKNYVEDMVIEADHKMTGHPKQPLLPLIRLRVEYTNDSYQLTPGRFANFFHDRVANPAEILLFRRKVLEKKVKKQSSDFESDLMESLIPPELEGTSMEDLLSEYFETSGDKGQLRVLGVKGISAAVKSYIEKDDRDAIDVVVDKQLDKTIERLVQRNLDGDDDDMIDGALEEYKQQRIDARVNELSEAREMLGERPAAAAGARGGARRVASDVEMQDDDDEDDGMPPPQQLFSSSTSRGGAARGRGGRGGGEGGARGRGGARGGRGAAARGGKAPVVVETNSIRNAFQRQSQSSQQSAASSSNSSRSNAAASSSSRTTAAGKRNNTSAIRYVEDSDSD